LQSSVINIPAWFFLSFPIIWIFYSNSTETYLTTLFKNFWFREKFMTNRHNVTKFCIPRSLKGKYPPSPHIFLYLIHFIAC
jgi:hypothetical protein